MSGIKLKRVYETPSPQDGRRFLVERLWPRGVKKDSLKFDDWLKDVAPSTELRKWFQHDPGKWREFQRRYRAELEQQSEACEAILRAARAGSVTLLYSAHDAEHNNAIVLRDYLELKMKSKRYASASERARGKSEFTFR